jgi:hypothetical protein
MCHSSTLYNELRRLSKDSATFQANPSVDNLLTAISKLVTPELQENDDLLSSSGSEVTDLIFQFRSFRQVQRVPISGGQLQSR